MVKYMCPVCGYCGLDELPYDENGASYSYEICSCCGFEYGFDDYLEGFSFEEYREKWIERGATFKRKEDEPAEWNLDAARRQIQKLQQIKNDVNSEYGRFIRNWNKAFEDARNKE